MKAAKQCSKSAVNKSFCFEFYFFSLTSASLVLFCWFCFFAFICAIYSFKFIAYESVYPGKWMSKRASDWVWLKRIIFSFCDALYFRSFAFTIFIREHRRIAVFSIEVFFVFLISTSYFRPYLECVTFWQYAMLTCTRTVSSFSHFLYQRRSKNK